MSKNKLEPLNVFRYNRETKHMNYVWGRKNKKLWGFGLSTKEFTFGRKNMPLRKNPQRNRNTPSFIRNGVIVGKESNYGRPDKRFAFEDNIDKANVNSKKRYYKKIHKKSGRKLRLL